MVDQDEVYSVGKGMRTYGGSFVKQLGELLHKADSNNQQKIKDTWPEYWAEYLNLGLKMEMD